MRDMIMEGSEGGGALVGVVGRDILCPGVAFETVFPNLEWLALMLKVDSVMCSCPTKSKLRVCLVRTCVHFDFRALQN